MPVDNLIVDELFNLNNVIENWIPIIIAVIALAVSIFTSLLSKRAFITSSRPYVWATNLEVEGEGYKSSAIACYVSNSPAKIISHEFSMKSDNEEVGNYHDKNFLRYPNEKFRWIIYTDDETFENSLENCLKNQLTLTRRNYIEYSSLNGGKRYFHELVQVYDSEVEYWETIMENGN